MLTFLILIIIDLINKRQSHFYLGNKYIHKLTIQPREVYFKMIRRHDGFLFHAAYNKFSVGPESDGFRLSFNESSFKGTRMFELFVCIIVFSLRADRGFVPPGGFLQTYLI